MILPETQAKTPNANTIIEALAPNQSLVPASTTKLVTTATALEIFGPNLRFATKIKYAGTIDTNGVLNGNIYIEGGGDPCLGTPRFTEHYGSFMRKWANLLR